MCSRGYVRKSEGNQPVETESAVAECVRKNILLLDIRCDFHVQTRRLIGDTASSEWEPSGSTGMRGEAGLVVD